MSDHREVRKVYSKSERKMVEIPKDIRVTVDAYKTFKRPAFKVNKKRKGDNSEREETEGQNMERLRDK